MSVTDEHRMSPSKILSKTKKADDKTAKKDGDEDDKKKAGAGRKGNAMLDYIAKCKANAKG